MRPEFPDVPDPATPPVVSNAGPLSPPTEPTSPDSPRTPADRALAAAAESGKAVEVVEWRTETSITYANPDGSFTDERAAGPVRVETDAGGWVPVDATLVADEDGVHPRATPNEIVLSDGDGGESLMRVTDPGDAEPSLAERRTGEAAREVAGDRSVSVDVAEDLPVPRLDGTRAIYPGVWDGADLVVEASTVGAEVSVVIGERGRGRRVYEFPLGFDGLSATQDETGGLVLRDAGGTRVGYSPAPVMFDAVGDPVSGLREDYGRVSSRLVERGDGQVLVVTPDPAFLADPDTAYPVTIDPATDLYPSRDTHVFQTVPNQSYDSSVGLNVGTHPWTAAMRAFIRFGTSTFEDQTIVGGELIVFQKGAGSCVATPVDVYEATDLAAGATWNTQPSVVGPKRGSANTTGDQVACPAQVGHKFIDIKPLVQKWGVDAATTGTLTLRASETDTTHRKVFGSLESGWTTPILRVDYRTTPDPPVNLRPPAGAAVDTLAPVLKATLAGGDPGVSQLAVFEVFDANQVQVAGNGDILKQPGQEAVWQMPADVLRPGQSYTWTAKGCVPLGGYCSAPSSGSFTVSPGLAAGDRGFFTYTGLSVSDRASAKVNVASGSLVVTNTDLSVAGTDMAMSIARTYNSFGGGGDKMLGHRWTASHTNTVRLEKHPDGSFTFYDGSGFVSLITRGDDGSYQTSGDLDATFVDAGGFGVYVLRFNHDRGLRSQGDKLYFWNSQYQSGAKEGLLAFSVNRNGQNNAMVYAPGSTTLSGVSDSQTRDVNYTITGGHLTKAVDVTNRQVVYTYDSADDLRTVTDLEGEVTSYDYDGSHNLTKITDPNGGIVRAAYDGASRVETLTRENNGVDETTTFVYTDPAPGQQGTTVVTDANGHATTYRWDNANRVTRVTNALGQNEDTTYDPNSNVETISQPGSRVTTTSYDDRNNLESSEMATGATATATYPSTGNVLDYQPATATDHQSNVTGFTYDPAGNTTQTDNSLPTQDTASATYENSTGTVCGAKVGQICSSTDARGKVTSYDYDPHGNLTRVVPPVPLGDVDITYDALSRVQTVDDGKGQVRTYTYDKLDRITSVTYPGVTPFSYTYDDNGSVTRRTEGSGTWDMGYDDANRLVTQDGPEDLTFTYDPVGNVESVTNSNGTTEYDYTDINMVSKLRDPQGAETVYGYEPTDGTRRTDVDYPNGVTIDITYDGSSRTERVTSRDSGGSLLSDDRYTFTDPNSSNPNDDTALRQSWTALNGTEQRYSYDALNRLKTATPFFGGAQVTPVYSYSYDGVGNRTQAIEDGVTRNFSYNNADQINGATHDANGNITATTAGYGITAAAYNSVDQTTSVTPTGSAARSSTYAGTSQTHWLTSGVTSFDTTASLGITRTTTGSTATAYTREPDGTLVSMRRGTETFYYIPDGRGSVSVLTSGAGLVENVYRYGPYGNAEYALENTTQPFRWNAGYTLDGTIYKFGARYYDQTTARWTQVDPIASEPRYAYAGGDPINKADPSGLFSLSDAVPIVAGGVAASIVSDIASASTFLLTGNPGAAVGAGIVGGCVGGVLGFGVGRIATGEDFTGEQAAGACAGGAVAGLFL